MQTVLVSKIAKSFGNTRAVADVSFAVNRGEIFALLGPNGAGKTTTIRLMLNIFKPDQGTVSILGGPMTEMKKRRIGYMPEERGLYQDIPLERCLLYLATLKGIPTAEARRRLDGYLKRFDLAQHRRKKVKELSKGMQQKAQIISTIMHQPELIIVDEPFAALDPVNTEMVKQLLQDLRDQGTTIVMSTHQMHHAEALCDRILLIHQGQNVLYGSLQDARRQFAGDALLVQAADDLPTLAGVSQVSPNNGSTKLTLEQGTTPQDILRALVAHDVHIDRFEVALPTLNEIFIQVVGQGEG